MNIHDVTNFCLVNTLMITGTFGFSFVSRGIPTADVSACLISLWMPFLMQPSYLSRLWDWHTFGKALFVSPPSLLILKKMSKSLMLAFKIHWSQAYQKLLYIFYGYIWSASSFMVIGVQTENKSWRIFKVLHGKFSKLMSL